jgi:hypothetical protein
VPQPQLARSKIWVGRARPGESGSDRRRPPDPRATRGIDCPGTGRGQPRAKTILFSDRAVLRWVGGQPYFMFRVVETRKQGLTEAHVRCYAVHRNQT